VNIFSERLGGLVTSVPSHGDQFSYWMPPMARIRDAFLDCAIYLYGSEADAEDGKRTGGSGFLVGVKATDPSINLVVLYAVTNKHVIERGNTVIRMNKKDGRKAINPTDERAWAYHKNGDDLAICQILFDPLIYKSRHVLTTDFIDNIIIDEMNIGPGDDVFVIGRFINHEGKQRNLPTARFGCIAQMPWEPIKQDTGFEQESFLVEARSIGGYSGSPVFVFIPVATVREGVKDWGTPDKILRPHGPWLLGVDWGHILDWEPVRDAMERPINPDPKAMRVRTNTGMMGVVPSWKLTELLNDDAVVEQRERFIKEILKDMPSALD
jgi:hypothetical protein